MTYMQSVLARLPELQKKPDVRILAIESSCDETAAAVVQNGRVVLSNVVSSQIPLHARYGGVVPEIASRAHVEAIDGVVSQALADSGCSLSDIDAIAVTCGPGLVGALLVGVSYAKALAYGCDKPLIAVHHIEGHVSANFISNPELTPPFTCLVVSGGHSHLMQVLDYGKYRLLGCTQDDAAGEAFDKAARVLSLPYPGGPLLDKLAQSGDPKKYVLPHAHTDGKYDFSFSGLKTAFINLAHHLEQIGEPYKKEDMAAVFRACVVDTLLDKTMRALADTSASKLALAGGVSANSLLRAQAQARCERAGVSLYMPALSLCGDNAAMIGSAAYYRLLRGEAADLSLNAVPDLRIAYQ